MNLKLYNTVLRGQSDNNIDFNDFISLLIGLGFYKARQKGSHMHFKHPCGCRMNVQKDGAKAKAYQVAQLRKMIQQYKL